MRIEISLPGHEGTITSPTGPGGDVIAHRPVCSCGWAGSADLPPDETGRMRATSEWLDHMRPHFAMAPPDWMMHRSDTLRAAIEDLTARWPLQSLGVLADVERWHRTLLDEAVAAARAGGASWMEIGQALGITKQSAHERFSKRLR
ncbi:hypothetical protein [Catenuloplanes atrovinosus]|uniref:Uncharacterized protein n=1 Tax=Catenuloplanes atrovinosus TaxID=137266 RepID=A0AAE3YJP8_9ACTN|nr:hypothetical protein [Catenuloplanes atrovinosus]MDR7275093.1 hypothetical protein [Catenuloplanes atrovinosus]